MHDVLNYLSRKGSDGKFQFRPFFIDVMSHITRSPTTRIDLPRLDK